MSNKIKLNALVGFDYIRIIATLKADNKFIYLHNEKINLSNAKKRHDIKNQIKNVIKNIEKKISMKFKKINLIFDDFMKGSNKLGITEKIIEDSVEYAEDRFLSSNDCDRFIDLMIEKYKNNEDKQLISVVPFKFVFIERDSSAEKEISSFPIDKKIKKLKTTFSIRYMDKKVYSKIIDFFDILDLKINNIALESQIAICSNYLNEECGKTNFTLAIKTNKSVLISSVNNIVILTDELNSNYTFDNLIRKIKQEFSISYEEAKNLVNWYGGLTFDENKKNEIIYSSIECSSKPIRRYEIINIIKSFLKSVCTDAYQLIKKKTKNLKQKIELKIVGELSKMDGLLGYCSKYFESIFLKPNETNAIKTFAWNKGCEVSENYYYFTKILSNKTRPETFYYNINDNYEKNHKQNEHAFDFEIRTIKADAVLV